MVFNLDGSTVRTGSLTWAFTIATGSLIALKVYNAFVYHVTWAYFNHHIQEGQLIDDC